MRDQDDLSERLSHILNGLNALMRTMGNKKAKHQPYKRVIEFKDDSKKGNIIDGGITNMTVTEVVNS